MWKITIKCTNNNRIKSKIICFCACNATVCVRVYLINGFHPKNYVLAVWESKNQ